MWREGDLMRSRVPAPLTLASPRSAIATAAGAGKDSEGSARDSARSTPGTIPFCNKLGIHIPSLTKHFSTTLEQSITGRTSSSGSTTTSGKYAADKSVEAQGDVLRARRAQASPMGSPVGSPAGHGAGLGLGALGGGLSPKSPGAGGGAAYDDQYAGPTPGGAPPSPGSPAKSSSFGRFLGGWK